ncbi:unnamed protein product [Caenorhabditis nigoni]
MPIRILSLPAKDLQYALECMDFGDLIVFSLCSKRTKNLVKSLNLQIDPILADVCKNYICLQLRPSKIRGVPHDPDPLFLFLTFSNFWIKLDRKNGIAVWKEDGFICRSHTKLMPIRFLSLPVADLQYALECMDIGDLIALSLCSKRTKNLVKSSNRNIEPISAEVYKNTIHLIIKPNLQFLLRDDYFSIALYRGDGIEIWRKPGFTQCHWVAHFLSISRTSMIQKLIISNASPISYLDIVKKINPRCFTLDISDNCSSELTIAAVLKLGSIARLVKIDNDPFNNKRHHISELLTLNLHYLCFNIMQNPFKLELSDLLMVNSEHLTIESAVIPEKDLNRFLKLWMKGNHSFYRLKYIELFPWEQIKHEDVLKEIEYQVVDHKRRLSRADGKELLVTVEPDFVVFEISIP